MLIVALVIVAYLAVGFLSVFLVEMYDGAPMGDNLSVSMFFLWPIMWLIAMPFLASELATKVRKSKRKL